MDEPANLLSGNRTVAKDRKSTGVLPALTKRLSRVAGGLHDNELRREACFSLPVIVFG
jgi:hypothetical protein